MVALIEHPQAGARGFLGDLYRLGPGDQPVEFSEDHNRGLSQPVQHAGQDAADLVSASLRTLAHPEQAAALARQGAAALREFADIALLPEDPPTPLKRKLGSHKQVHPIDIHERPTVQGTFVGHHVFSLHDPDIDAFERDGVDVADVQPGDLLVLHCCLLHRSGRNRGDRARWTALCRFGNGLDPAIVKRGWRSVRDGDGARLFTELHPHLVHHVRDSSD